MTAPDSTNAQHSRLSRASSLTAPPIRSTQTARPAHARSPTLPTSACASRCSTDRSSASPTSSRCSGPPSNVVGSDEDAGVRTASSASTRAAATGQQSTRLHHTQHATPAGAAVDPPAKPALPSAEIVTFGVMPDETALRAIRDYQALAQNDLSFAKGDRLTLLDDKGDWWYVKSQDGQTGYVPRAYVAKVGSLEEYDWFHGRIPRGRAIALLRVCGTEGTFLVRESETMPGTYTLSQRYAAVRRAPVAMASSRRGRNAGWRPAGRAAMFVTFASCAGTVVNSTSSIGMSFPRFPISSSTIAYTRSARCCRSRPRCRMSCRRRP